MSTDIDWSSRPEPYCWIGPQFRRECERIVGAEPRRMPRRQPAESAQAIKRRRKALGLSQPALGIATGVSRWSIGYAETDLATAAMASRITDTLDRLEAAKAQAEG